MPEDPVDVVSRLGGSATTVQILQFTSRRRLTSAVHAGRLVRPRRGVHVLPALPDAAAVAASAGGVVSHASAAAWWRLDLVRRPDVVHVTVPHGAKPAAQAGVRYHWSVLPMNPNQCVTSLERTVLDCAAALPFDEALAVADSALRLQLVTREALSAAAAAGNRVGRQRRLRVVRLADGRAANAFESRLRGLVLDAGLTGFEPQFEIRLPGRDVRVDLADPELRVVLEADGFEHHGPRAALARDCERYDELVADGWAVLRFAWEHVMFRPAWVAKIVRETCRPRLAITYHRT